MSGIYIGTGSSTATLLPVQTYHDEPFVIPVVSEDKTIFPNWDSACTYGYNLGVSDYRGRITQLSGLPYDNGRVKAVSVNSATSFTCSGMHVCPDQGASHVYHFYPAFVANNGHTAEESAKQKIRGRLYDSFDDYLHVPGVNLNATGWPSNRGIDSSANLYCYQIDNVGQTIKIKGGFLVMRIIGSNCVLSGIQVDAVQGGDGTPRMVQVGDKMILSKDGCTARQTATLNYSSKIVTVDGDQYYVILIKEASLASGNLLVSVPHFSITSPSDEVRVELSQWGLTFGV